MGILMQIIILKRISFILIELQVIKKTSQRKTVIMINCVNNYKYFPIKKYYKSAVIDGFMCHSLAISNWTIFGHVLSSGTK